MVDKPKYTREQLQAALLKYQEAGDAEAVSMIEGELAKLAKPVEAVALSGPRYSMGQLQETLEIKRQEGDREAVRLIEAEIGKMQPGAPENEIAGDYAALTPLPEDDFERTGVVPLDFVRRIADNTYGKAKRYFTEKSTDEILDDAKAAGVGVADYLAETDVLDMPGDFVDAVVIKPAEQIKENADRQLISMIRTIADPENAGKYAEEAERAQAETAQIIGSFVAGGRSMQAIPGRRRGPDVPEKDAPEVDVEKTVEVIPEKPSAPSVEGDLEAVSAQVKKAAKGDEKKMAEAAAMTAPDPATVLAAEQLGIMEHLQPGHVTTNQAFRELDAAIKSFPGSIAKASEVEGLLKVAQRADQIITDFGGTRDWSTLNIKVKDELQSARDAFNKQSGALYDEIAETIPKATRIEANNALEYLNQRISDVGGEEFLEAFEREVLKAIRTDGGDLPTYGRLDSKRKKFVNARVNRNSPWAGENEFYRDALEDQLLADQKAIAEQFGKLDEFEMAQQLRAQQKSIQDDMASLFGKQLNDTIVGKLEGGVKALSKGDTKRFLETIKRVPESMRQEVVASGLKSAFGNAKDISFARFSNWFDGLKENKQAYNALMSNLPPDARKQIEALARVSKGIAKSRKEFIATGRLTEAKEILKQTDGFMRRAYEAGSASLTPAAAIEYGMTSIGLPGGGLMYGVGSALQKARNKPNSLKAVDEMIGSDEFKELASSATKEQQTKAAEKMAKSSAFKKFWKLTEKMRMDDPDLFARPQEPVAWIMASLAVKEETE